MNSGSRTSPGSGSAGGTTSHDLERRLAGDEPGRDQVRRRTASRTRSPAAKEAIERFFTPEFRNRLDGIVTFKSLSPEVMETIVDKFVLELEAQLRERKVAIDLRPEARTHLVTKGFDPVYGARPLNRLVQTEVRNPLTDEILFGRLEHGGTVHVGFDGEKLAFEYDSAPPPDPSPTPPAAVPA